MSLSICIFAHNEERLLHRCIKALAPAATGRDFAAHILVNGSTDDTAAIARMFAGLDERITVRELALADKANAWNVYVYDIAPAAEANAVHIFLDGDVRPSEGSFAALADGLASAPRAYGAGALPITGRSRRGWARRLLVNRYLSGNLYALGAGALEKIRSRNIIMPCGAKGEDGLLTYLLLTDFKGGRDDSHRDRIVNPVDATFEFDSLRLNRADLGIFHRRLRRYSERHFQKQILYRLLKRDGLAALPENIYDIYTEENLRDAKPRIDPVNFWYDRAMRPELASRTRGRA